MYHPVCNFQTNSRYDSQIAVLGADFQKKMAAQKYFMVSEMNWYSDCMNEILGLDEPKCEIRKQNTIVLVFGPP